MTSSRSAPSLACLPAALLELIGVQLPLRDRLRFMTLSKPFLAVGSSSTSLWQDLSFTLQAPADVERMARWLAGKRQRLGALHIRVLQEDPEDEDEDPHAAKVAFDRQLLLLLGFLSGTALHTLALSRLPFMEVGGWLALLPELRSLDVEAREVTVQPGLSCATRLSQLRLRSEEGAVELLPGCLPASLRSLHIDLVFCDTSDPLASGPLPRLERLGLLNYMPLKRGTLDAIAGMPALTSLQLKGPSMERLLERALPVGLAELHVDRLDPLHEATVLQLAGLTRLERLSLWQSLETNMPPCLLTLPHLTYLDLRFNPDLAALPIAAIPSAASRLECLALDLRPATRVLDQLSGLSELRQLYLNCDDPVPLKEEEALALFETVGRLAQLHTLKALGRFGRRTFTVTDAVCEACKSLAVQRPCLRFVFEVDGGYRRWAQAFL